MAPTYNWTGFYIGANLGGGWGTIESNLVSLGGVPVPLPLASHGTNGLIGGGQIGYNYQMNWVVLGIQGDFDGSSIKGTAPCVVILSCSASNRWIATVTGRIGGVVADRTLLYVKGGGAWANTNYSVSDPLGFIGFGTSSTSSTRSGWLLGTGVEYSFTQNWSGLIEYDHMDFGSRNLTFTAPGFPTSIANIKDTINVIKAGVNYKF